jgi:hypothetical protein
MFCFILNGFQVLAKPLDLQDQGQQNLVMQVLKLVLNCLNFDFIGSSADESTDDLCTVQIPTSWRTGERKAYQEGQPASTAQNSAVEVCRHGLLLVHSQKRAPMVATDTQNPSP